MCPHRIVKGQRLPRLHELDVTQLDTQVILVKLNTCGRGSSSRVVNKHETGDSSSINRLQAHAELANQGSMTAACPVVSHPGNAAALLHPPE